MRRLARQRHLRVDAASVVPARRWCVNSASIADWQWQRRPVAGADSDHAVNLWDYARQRQKDAVAYAAYEQEQLLKEMAEHRDYQSLLDAEKFEEVDVEVAVDAAGNEVETAGSADGRSKEAEGAAARQPPIMTATEQLAFEATKGASSAAAAREQGSSSSSSSIGSRGGAASSSSGSSSTSSSSRSDGPQSSAGVPLPPGAVRWEVRKKKIPRERPYVRSVEFFDRHVTLDRSYSGSAEARIIGRFENFWFNYIRYYFTNEILIGKDRFGVRFFVKWNYMRIRHEQRLARRRDKNKRHAPYGTYVTDDMMWFRWTRQQRQDPPTVAEEEFRRRTATQYIGPMALGDESIENMYMRNLSTLGYGPLAQETNDDEQLDDPMRRNVRVYNRDPQEEHEKREKEKRSTWTNAFVKGDLLYNEEEVQSMRMEIGQIFRDKEWAELELKRQMRAKTIKEAEAERKRQPQSPLSATDPVSVEDGTWTPPRHQWHRLDRDMPYYGGITDLTTPELERLRLEAGQLEEERAAIRKELGITDVGDMKEGRDPIDKGHGPYSVPPTRESWKPKVWAESWGTGGGFRY